MNRWTIFAGIIVATGLLYQLQIEKLTLNDVFDADVKKTSAVKADEIENVVVKDRIFAAILSPEKVDEKTVEDFLEDLSKKQDVKTFVVVAENHSLRGRYKIALSKYNYETIAGVLEIDNPMADKIILGNEKNIGVNSYYSIGEEYSVGRIAPYIKEFFPNSKIVPIFIKDYIGDEEVQKLAEILKEKVGDDTLVIGATAFSKNFSPQIAEFHDALSENVLTTLDINAVPQLDVDSKPVIFVLLDFLKDQGFEKAEIVDHTVHENSSSFISTYKKGEADLSERDFTILAFGDMMLSRYVRTLMDENGLDYIFENIIGHEAKFFEGADTIFANLEGPIKGQGTKGGRAMVFAFNEDVAPFLKKYGFTLFSIANNHAKDQGKEGVKTTIEALEKNELGWCGNADGADEDGIYYNKVGEKKFAFLCFQDITTHLDDAAAIELIKSTRPNVDYLIVSVHWGYEYKNRPDYSLQIEPGHAFIDAGADFIIGHHPHVVQGFEIYNDRFIFYSLGNFVFDQYWAIMTQEELGLGIVLDDNGGEELKTKVYLFPMKSENSQSRLMNEDEKKKWTEEFLLFGSYDDEMKEMIRNGLVIH